MPFRKTILVICLFIFSQTGRAACDQTLSVGSNVANAVAKANAGATICLNAGDYGNVTLTQISKTAPVILQSTSGRSAKAAFDITLSSYITIKSMTVSSLSLSFQAKNITVSDSTFTGQTVINMGENGGNYGNAGILIDGNTFDGISACSNCYEGRVQVMSVLPCGVTISNNHFGSGGESDGIQTGANGLVIGPGNVFEGLLQGNYGRHIDSIQGYGQTNTIITGNYFINDTIYVGFYDGGVNETITGNVFGPSATNEQKLQLGSVQGLSFTHNSLKGNFVVAQGAKSGSAKNSGAVYRNNLFVGVSIADTGDQPGCATGCVYENNLFSSSADARGTHNVIGAPTFTGGTIPSAWSGYLLTSASLGHSAATDGKDLGALSFGGVTAYPILAAPKNLRVLRQ